jgi:hypothetical protein
MTFDIPFDQPLDARWHNYINRKRENPHGNSLVGHHLVYVVRFELD